MLIFTGYPQLRAVLVRYVKRTIGGCVGRDLQRGFALLTLLPLSQHKLGENQSLSLITCAGLGLTDASPQGKLSPDEIALLLYIVLQDVPVCWICLDSSGVLIAPCNCPR